MSKKPEDTNYITSEKLQKFIKDAIDTEGCTQKEFADAVGISATIINRTILYKSVPSIKTLIKLADYFQVPILYMFGEVDDEYFAPTKAPSTFLKRLEELTNEKGEKYSALAHTMTFSSNAVYEWIRNNSIPSLDYLKQLAHHFDVSVDYLLGRTNDRK